jgi:hypothetical protein
MWPSTPGVLNVNGGWKTAATGIIITWKMKKGSGTGCSGQGIMRVGRGINGFCMGFLREETTEIYLLKKPCRYNSIFIN